MVDKPVMITILLCLISFMGCVQGGSRIDEIDESVAQLNLSLDELNEHTEKQIRRRQEILSSIQNDLQPRAGITSIDTTPATQPTATPTPVFSANDIRSTSLEELLTSPSQETVLTNSKMDPAKDLLDQQEYARAAYLFYEVYLDEEENDSVREEGLFYAGEAFFLNKDWNQTIDTYLRFFQEFPNSAHIPQSLLKTGKSYEKLELPEKAQAVYQHLQKIFPLSDEAMGLH